MIIIFTANLVFLSFHLSISNNSVEIAIYTFLVVRKYFIVIIIVYIGATCFVLFCLVSYAFIIVYPIPIKTFAIISS